MTRRKTMSVVYKNAELYNVSEVHKTERGLEMFRIPKAVEEKCGPRVALMNSNACGVEIRFNMVSDKVDITLCAPEGADSFFLVYYGAVGSGWQECIKGFNDVPKTVTVSKPEKLERLQKISDSIGTDFDPALVRLRFPNRKVFIKDIVGDITPPRPDQVPKLRMLSYGSSITHGSLGILPTNTYAGRCAEKLGVDLINLGIAGGACLEPAMADYIASRDDWDFATVEMGINILGIEPCDFKSRVMNMVKTVASSHPDKKVFFIDVFYCEEDLAGGKRAEVFRSIVKECTAKYLEEGLSNIVYVNGLDMLPNAAGLSGDFTHPTVRGCETISDNLIAKIKSEMPELFK